MLNIQYIRYTTAQGQSKIKLIDNENNRIYFDSYEMIRKFNLQGFGAANLKAFLAKRGVSCETTSLGDRELLLFSDEVLYNMALFLFKMRKSLS